MSDGHEQDLSVARQLGRLTAELEALKEAQAQTRADTKGELAALRSELGGMRAEVSELTKARIKAGAWLTLVISAIGMAGGAAGGKVAHLLGLLNATPPNTP